MSPASPTTTSAIPESKRNALPTITFPFQSSIGAAGSSRARRQYQNYPPESPGKFY